MDLSFFGNEWPSMLASKMSASPSFGLREGDGIGAGAAAEIEHAANTIRRDGFHDGAGAFFGVAVQGGDEGHDAALVAGACGNGCTGADCVRERGSTIPKIGGVQQRGSRAVWRAIREKERSGGRVAEGVAGFFRAAAKAVLAQGRSGEC